MIIEMLSNINLGRDLMILAPRGRVVVIGNRGVRGNRCAKYHDA